MTFKQNGRFIPDRLKSDPKSTFSRPVSLPQNEFCSHPKTQNDIFGPKRRKDLGFNVTDSGQFTRDDSFQKHRTYRPRLTPK